MIYIRMLYNHYDEELCVGNTYGLKNKWLVTLIS